MSIYDIGQEVRYWGTFQNTGGTPVDPTTVNFYWQPPDGPGTYYSGTKAAVGTYYVDRTHTAGGYALWGWEGTGAIQTSDYGRDFIRYRGTNA